MDLAVYRAWAVRPTLHRRPKRRRHTAMTSLLPLLSAVLLLVGQVGAEITVALSQKGMDEISRFGVDHGMSVLKDMPPIYLALLTTADPGLQPLGSVLMSNLVYLRELRLLLEDDSLGLLLKDFHLRSRSRLSANSWPLPAWPVFGHLGEEEVFLNLTLPQIFISFRPSDPPPGTPAKLRVGACTVSDPDISTKAKNHWLVGAGLSIGASWARGKIPAMLCDQVGAMLDGALQGTSGSFPLSSALSPESPEPLQSLLRHRVALAYRLAALKVTKGALAATVDLTWDGLRSGTADLVQDFENATELELPPSASALRDRRLLPRAGEVTLRRLEISLKNNRELSFWLHPDFLNDLLEKMDVDMLVMEDDVPTTSEKIPKRSRDFFSVMCSHCLFQLKAYAHGPPRFVVVNDSLEVTAFLKVLVTMPDSGFSLLKATLWIFNPTSSESSPFIEFVSLFVVGVTPSVADGVLRAEVSLDSVKIDMRDSAFPPDWDFFVSDLVSGMIHGMMWPGMQSMIHRLTLERGIAIPATCGVDPNSFRLALTGGRVSLTTDLSLHRLDMTACKASLRGNLAGLEVGGGKNLNMGRR